MTREIKFRAWNVEKKSMHYTGCEILNMPGFDYMEFTGLLDKNGNEIYEGDILKFPIETKSGLVEVKGIMEFDQTRAQFGVNYLTELDLPEHVENKESRFGKPEVVGNTYENSELLK